MLSFIFALFIAMINKVVICQRGTFYASGFPGTEINFQSTGQGNDQRESEIIRLLNPMHYFQIRNVEEIRVCSF